MPLLIEATGYSTVARGLVAGHWASGTGYRTGPRDWPANTG
jgi:hypothetical protein